MNDINNKDNSFIFLEKDTLHLLMNHLLNNVEQGTSNDSQVEIVGVLEQIIAEHQKEFEEILTLLKEKP